MSGRSRKTDLMTTNSTTNPITFDILYDDDGGALVGIFVGGEEHSTHRMRANVARLWAQQEVAYMTSRQEAEAAFLALVNKAPWLAQANN